MTDISVLQTLLHWKLLKCSHQWPGPDGWTCIVEAAIVAAGFPYRRIMLTEDAPPDFSPVISAYLIELNDGLPDGERQRLSVFVDRLSNSAGNEKIENQRRQLIESETVTRVLPQLLRSLKMRMSAEICGHELLSASSLLDRVVTRLQGAGMLSPPGFGSRTSSHCRVAAAARLACAAFKATGQKSVVDRAIAIADAALQIRIRPSEASR